MLEGDAERSALRRFVATYAPLFSVNLLGLVAVRIWIQCNLYDRYLSTDSGIVTIVSNLFRVIVIVALIAWAVRRGFSERLQGRLFSLSILAMTAASALFLIQTATGSTALVWAACLLAGFGIAWGGGRWICLYVRLTPGEAFLYAFASLAVSSLLGFLLGMLPEHITYLIALLMPALSFIAYERADRLVSERPRPVERKRAYDAEPRSTYLRLIAGIALFNLALGIARGFPHGASIELPPLFQALHQGLVVLLCAGVAWWALGMRKAVRFSTLWNVSMTFVAAGALALASLDKTLEPFGAMFIAAANTFAVGLLWISCCDMARHLSAPAYLVLGAAWTAHIAPRELGRALIWVAEPHTESAIVIATGVVLLLAASMAFLLNNSIPTKRALFADLQAEGASAPTFEVPAPAPETPAPALVEAAPAPPAPAVLSDPLEAKLRLLRERHFLTERETEVVRHLAQGRSKTAIGQKLYISENTVRTYVKNIYGKLDIHSKQELLDLLDQLDASGALDMPGSQR